MLRVFIFLLFFCELSAFDFPRARGPHQIQVGPESYYVQREKIGGSRQCGWVHGIAASYDRIRRYTLYWGIEGHCGKGELSGLSGRHQRLKSDLYEASLETRLGYTFGRKTYPKATFSLFGSWGCYQGGNQFRSPTRIPVYFRKAYQWGGGGLLLAVTPFRSCEQFTAGLNVSGRYMFDGKVKVTNDPKYDDMKLLMDEAMHYLVELPLNYQFQRHLKGWGACLTPFYHTRKLGGRPNFPQDFIETCYTIWGLRYSVSYWF